MHWATLSLRPWSQSVYFICALSVIYMHLSTAYYTEIRGYQQPKPNQSTQSKSGYGDKSNKFQMKSPYINDNFVNNYNKKSRYPDTEYVNGRFFEQQPKGPVHAAVKSKFSVEYVDTHYPSFKPEPQIIEITGSPVPIILQFKSISSPIKLQQMHVPEKAGDVQESNSEDEPKILKHSVIKPIIQEVKEIITPFRRLWQEIRPVQEEIHTVVAKAANSPQGNSQYGHNGGYNASQNSGNQISNGGYENKGLNYD